MTKREIASLVIKLMGIFILLRSISYAPMMIGNAFQIGEQLFATLMYILVCVIAVGWGLLIIILSDRIGKWLIQDDHAVELPGAVRKEDVMLVVFTCVGLYLIVTAIPTFVLYLTQLFRYGDSGISSGSYYWVLHLTAPIVKIGIGIWLFVGSKGIVKFWQKIRS